MYNIIDTTSSRVLASFATMKEVRAWLKKHYTRFYCIAKDGKQYSYFGKLID